MVRRAAAALLLALVAMLAVPVAAGAARFVAYRLGQTLYDADNRLSAADRAAINQSIVSAAARGLAAVVYVESGDRGSDRLKSDARDLTGEWGIESSRGAHDGVVILVDLEVGAGIHGAAAIWAGAGLHLSSAQIDQVYERDMLPSLRAGSLAAGVAGALTTLSADRSSWRSLLALAELLGGFFGLVGLMLYLISRGGHAKPAVRGAAPARPRPGTPTLAAGGGGPRDGRSGRAAAPRRDDPPGPSFPETRG